jgi:hypothetical protein
MRKLTIIGYSSSSLEMSFHNLFWLSFLPSIGTLSNIEAILLKAVLRFLSLAAAFPSVN